MKKLGLFLLMGIFAFNVSICAQDSNTSRNNGQRPNRGQMMTPKQQAEKLAKDLELTDEQKVQCEELFTKQQESRAKRRAEFQNNQNGNREAMREQMATERKAQDAELEKIIGADKMKKYIEARKQQMQRRGQDQTNRNTGTTKR